MTEQKTDVEHLVLTVGNSIATVDVTKSDDGYATEWWISSNFDGYLQVVGSYAFPIYGYTLEEASRKAKLLCGDVIDFALKTYGGEGSISVSPRVSDKARIAGVHLRGYLDSVASTSLLERTAEQFKLCEQFGVKDVAKLIAEIENVNVRAVHERIQRCRKADMLP
jgi:hypothetical protein